MNSPTVPGSASASDLAVKQLIRLAKGILERPGLQPILDYKMCLTSVNLSLDHVRPLTTYLLYPFQILIDNLPAYSRKITVPASCEELLLHSLDCLRIIFSKVAPISDATVFDSYLTMFITLLGQDEPTSPTICKPIPKISSDLRHSLLRCLSTLLTAVDQPLFNAKLVHDSQFKFKLGYLINLLVGLLKSPPKTHHFTIQSAALDLLRLFYLKTISRPFNDHSTASESVFKLKPDQVTLTAVHFTAFTLPSIVSTLQKLFAAINGGDYYQLHSDVLCSALNLLETVLQITFNTAQVFPDDATNSTEAPKETTGPTVHFNKVWFTQTTAKLRLALRAIFEALLEHPEARVRCTLDCVATSLLLNPCTTFSLAFADLLVRVPIAYHCSPDAPESIHFIRQFAQKTASLSESEFNQLLTTLETELLSHLSAISFGFPSNPNGTSSTELLPSLRILRGFFLILDSERLFHRFLLIDQHKATLFKVLVKCCQFDYAKEVQKWITSTDLTSAHEPENLFAFSQYLLHLNTAEQLETFTQTVHLLAVNPKSFPLLYDHLFALLTESALDPSILLLFNSVLSGLPPESIPKFKPYLEEIHRLYLGNLNISELTLLEEKSAEETFELKPIDFSSLSTICKPTNPFQEEKEKSASQVQRKAKAEKRFIYQQALLLQGITICNCLLLQADPTIEGHFLRNTFVHFLEAYACQVEIVACTARRMLQHLGSVFTSGDGTVPGLVHQNIDYLYSCMTTSLDVAILQQVDAPKTAVVGCLDAVLFRVDQYSLKTVQASLETILKILVEYHRTSGGVVELATLDYLNRLMDQILTIIHQYSIRPLVRYSPALTQLLSILTAYLELVEVVCDQNPDLAPRRIEEKAQDRAKKAVSDLEEYLKNVRFLQAQEKAQFKMDLEEAPEQEVKVDEEPTPKEEPSILQSPIIQSRAGDILHQCSYLLSDANIDIRLAVLRLACKSMKLLRSFEDVLLPYLHKLWPPLVARFSTESDHPLILSRAYSCLLLASEVSGDFLLSRTRKEILPRLIGFLQEALDRRVAYFTANRRLLTIKSVEYYAECELLRSFGQLMVNLKLRPADLWTLIPILLLYVNLKVIPGELRSLAFESLLELSRYDSGSVRFYVHRLERLYFDVQRSTDKDDCQCQTLGPCLRDCVAKWRRYMLPRDGGSLLKDLSDHLDAL